MIKKSCVRLLAIACALLMVVTAVPFSVAAAASGNLYEGWRHVSYDGGSDSSSYITYDQKAHTVTMNALSRNGEFLYLNRVAADGADSGADNVDKFGTDMTDFVIEFDVAISDYAGKAAVDGGDLGAGAGAFGLAFLGVNGDNLLNSSVVARMEYSTVGMRVSDYADITLPSGYTANYVDGQFTQWHWLFNNGATHHVKVVKSGNTISMDVANGYQSFAATLPDSFPASGYIGFVAEKVVATVSNVMVTNNTEGQQAYDQFFFSTNSVYGGNYEGWQQMSCGNGEPSDYVSYNENTHALHVNAIGNTQALYLNRLSYDDYNSSAENRERFPVDGMTDFVVEFDASLDSNSLQRGAVSLAFMGKDGGRMDICSIAARVDPTNIGFLWRSYYDVTMPGSYSYNYVDGKVTQWHWRFNATEIFHVKVTKVGYDIRMQVTNSTGVSVSDISGTLPGNIGLPEAGLVGLLIEDTAVTISDVEVTNTTPGYEAYTKFFTNPNANLMGCYEGWQYATTGSTNGITHNDVYRELNINAMDGQVHSLLLNREAGDGINSSKENLEKFGVSEMEDFTVEFDLMVNDYLYKNDGDNATGGGKFGLAFLSDSTGRLDTASLTAQIDYSSSGLYWNAYRDISMPSGYTNNYVNGVIAKQWHWLFNSSETRHVKIVKSGNTVTLVILDGYVNATYTLPDTLPASGFMGLMVQNMDVTVTNLTVTNTTDGQAVSATFFAPPTLVASEQHKGVTLNLYEQLDGSYMLEVAGTGTVPVWNTASLYASYAQSIQKLVISEGFTSIAYGAFKGLSGLETVDLPTSLTAIGGEAFKECQNLKSINLEEGLTSIGYAAFLKSGLTEVSIPNSVTTMGTWVFANCKSLTSVTFGASKLARKTLPARTFSGCSALKSVAFGSVLQIIDDYAFNQSGLETITLPANIKTVDNAAFYKASLKTVKIADGGATYLGWASFYGCASLESVYLGDSLKNISTWVFTACDSLRSITLPDSVTNVGRRTFSWCKGLETVTLSAGMTEIKNELFYGSTKLCKVTIPAGITAIGAQAFYKCTALDGVYIDSAAVMATITGPDAAGLLAKNAGKLTVRASITDIPAYVSETYPYTGYKTVDGVKYVIYSKNELSVEDGSLDPAFAPFLNAVPQVDYVTSYNPTSNEWSGIQAITYEGATRNGQKTKIFAYMGFPEGASATDKVPAVVLVHGGGGHAFAEWVKIWNDRGYAAIAMDNTGFFPSEAGKGLAGRESDNASVMWHHGLYGEFAEDGYVGIPDNDGMNYSSQPLDQQWMYHAVVSTIMAHNILQNDSRVDGDKIGITGVSWGGVITSLSIGYDNDYAFAIPIYGAGHLDESHAWMGPIFSGEKTAEMWSAADRFDRVDFPVMWLCWTDDNCFSINSNSKSYLDTKAAGSVLNMKLNWGHSHGYGWGPEDSYIFADSIIGRRTALTAVTQEPVIVQNADGTYTVTMTVSRDVSATAVTAQAHYITEPLSYSSKTEGAWATIDQTWSHVTCGVNGDTVTVTLPAEAEEFFITVTTATGTGTYDVCSRFVQGMPLADTDAAFASILSTTPRVVQMDDYDPTAAEWSNIEAITYDGAPLNGQKTKVFAYIGYPEGASATNKAPAMVLVHGGGGHAYAEWVKEWTDRGYVAIAMDTTGFFPSEAGKGIAGAESDNVNTLWHYGLYGAFAEAGYVNAPNNDDMNNASLPLDRQWMYHAVSSAILAHNVLKADPCVDNAKIGITGISWGCRITSLTIGYDTDYAFAIPVYGGGYEIESYSYGSNRLKTNIYNKTYWSAEERFDRVDFPVYWLSWASDTTGVTSVNGVSKSYLHTKDADSRMNIRRGWGHSHRQGWAPADIYLFADSIVKEQGAFTSITQEPAVVKNANGTYTVTLTVDPAADATAVTATAAYLNVPLSQCYLNSQWSGTHDWKTAAGTVSGNTVTVTLPADAVDFYVTITTATGTGTYDVCSQFVQGIG